MAYTPPPLLYMLATALDGLSAFERLDKTMPHRLKLGYSPFRTCADFVYVFCFGFDPLQLYNMKYNGYTLCCAPNIKDNQLNTER